MTFSKVVKHILAVESLLKFTVIVLWDPVRAQLAYMMPFTQTCGSPFHYGVENDRVVEKPGLRRHGLGPDQRYTVEAQGWIPQQSTVGHAGEMGG